MTTSDTPPGGDDAALVERLRAMHETWGLDIPEYGEAADALAAKDARIEALSVEVERVRVHGETLARQAQEWAGRAGAAEAALTEAQATIARLTGERDEALAIPAPEDALGREWGRNTFRAVLGESYRPEVWGKDRALHYTSLRHALRMARQRAPEAADVIAALIWRSVVVDNRSLYAFDVLDEAQARAERLEAALEFYADEKTWGTYYMAMSPWETDRGRRARDTLASICLPEGTP